MLRIRASEKQSLEEAEREAFVQHVYAILRDTWVSEVAARGEDNVKGMLRAWMPILMNARISTEKLIAKTMNVFFAMVADFEADPLAVEWVQQILDDPDDTGLAKVYRLEVRLFRIYEDAPTEAGANHG